MCFYYDQAFVFRDPVWKCKEVNRLTKKLVTYSQSVKLAGADSQDRMLLSGKKYSRSSRYYVHLSVVCSLLIFLSFTFVVCYWLFLVLHRRAFRSGMINGFLWFVQMCLWQRMVYNVYNQTQKPLVVIILFLSVCLPVGLSLSKSPPSAAADVLICVTSLIPRWLKLRPHCLCRHHLPMRHKSMMGSSMCFPKSSFQRNWIWLVQNQILPLRYWIWCMWNQILRGPVSSLTCPVDLYISISQGNYNVEQASGSLCVVSCATL